MNDTMRLTDISKKYLEKIFKNIPDAEKADAFDKLNFRLQRNCKEFHDLLNRISPQNKGDWQTVTDKPVIKIKKDVCANLLTYKKLYYLESSGDTVNVVIKDGVYEDHFIDGTYSRLKFYWVKDCEFDLEFIESNNRVRKNFSKPGDKYRYQLLEKENGYYKASVEIPSTNSFSTFRIYYE